MQRTGNACFLPALIIMAGLAAVAVPAGCSREGEYDDSRGTPRSAAPPSSGAIPRIVDLGRTFCIPCKMMAPILEDLKREYAGRLAVEFIDVGKDPDSARRYGIRAIPTQVFLDSSGKELYRHVGFYSKEDILKKWRDLGIGL